MANPDVTALAQADAAHLLHPLYHPAEHAGAHIWVKGEGATLTDAEGRTYLDGLSCLWNVNVGHGRAELAAAAAEQMAALAFVTGYTGSASIPAIRLAARLREVAYPNLTMTFFASGGAEANESAFKTARYYWKALGRPEKVKVIAREHAYHGVTLAAMSATGMAAYWPMFEPRVPNFVHTVSPYPYRFQGARPGESVGQAAARMLEETILREGPETVAAFIAEPVQGAGGIIVPPDDYFPRVREICTKHQLLFIADEVITGFGRTGTFFALTRWGVRPDILSFAKGITSGYLPLGGIMVSEEIGQVFHRVPPEKRWMHAFTYSGHPTCCAVALKNLEIIEREGLVERAARMGERLLKGLQSLSALPAVGDVRGLGLMCGVELVADKASKAPFPPDRKVGERVRREADARGLFTRVRGDVILLAPPLVVTEAQVDRIVQILGEAIPAAVKAA
ncbi:MAG: aspartate aminotransferase family protein [candidate division NC10 bacterium]|nr:aspartate aminotransferase family protein [candidate division NC10 bacterium]